MLDAREKKRTIAQDTSETQIMQLLFSFKKIIKTSLLQ